MTIKPIEQLAGEVKRGDLVRIELETSGGKPDQFAGFFYSICVAPAAVCVTIQKN